MTKNIWIFVRLQWVLVYWIVWIEDIHVSCQKGEEKICRLAKDLVKVGNDFSKIYGIPVVNKRISVTPIAMLVACSGGNPVEYALTLERCAQKLGVDFIGGY